FLSTESLNVVGFCDSVENLRSILHDFVRCLCQSGWFVELRSPVDRAVIGRTYLLPSVETGALCLVNK
ncbi:MAG: hypothetical protein ACO20P_16070, partial [bacterium]